MNAHRDSEDAARAVRMTGGEAVPLWHADPSLHDVDAVILLANNEMDACDVSRSLLVMADG